MLTIKRCGPPPLAHAECPAQGPEHQAPGTAGGHVLHQEVNLVSDSSSPHSLVGLNHLPHF